MAPDSNQATKAERIEMVARLLASRVPVEGRWFSDVDIKLDGYHFRFCRFDNCRLVYSTGDFVLERCFLGSGTVLTHTAAGTRAIRLFHVGYPQFDHYWQEWAPERHDDGTISIM